MQRLRSDFLLASWKRKVAYLEQPGKYINALQALIYFAHITWNKITARQVDVCVFQLKPATHPQFANKHSKYIHDRVFLDATRSYLSFPSDNVYFFALALYHTSLWSHKSITNDIVPYCWDPSLRL